MCVFRRFVSFRFVKALPPSGVTNRCTAKTKEASEQYKAVRAPSYNRQPPALQPLQAFQQVPIRSGLLSTTTAAERPILHLYAHHGPPSKLKTATHNQQVPLPIGRHHQQLISGGQETSSKNPPAGKRTGGSVTAHRAPLRRPAGPGTLTCKITTGTPSDKNFGPRPSTPEPLRPAAKHTTHAHTKRH